MGRVKIGGGGGKPLNSKGFTCLTSLDLQPLQLCNRTSRSNYAMGDIRAASTTYNHNVSRNYDDKHLVDIVDYSGTTKYVHLARMNGKMPTWSFGAGQSYAFSGAYSTMFPAVKYDETHMAVISYSTRTLIISIAEIDWDALTVKSHSNFTISLPSTAGTLNYREYLPKSFGDYLLVPTTTGIATIDMKKKTLASFVVTSAVPIVTKAKYDAETDSYYSWCFETSSTFTRRFVQFKITSSGYTQVNLQSISRESSSTDTAYNKCTDYYDNCCFTENYGFYILSTSAGFMFYRGTLSRADGVISISVGSSAFKTNTYTSYVTGCVPLQGDVVFFMARATSSSSIQPANYSMWCTINVSTGGLSAAQGSYYYWDMYLYPVNPWMFVYVTGTTSMVSGNHYSSYLRGTFYQLTAASAGITGYSCITYSGSTDDGIVKAAILK